MKANQTNRRRFLKFVGVGGATTLAAGMGAGQSMTFAATAAQTATTGFTLPPLPYAYNALEPHIDSQTMLLHHLKHHGAAVASLNTALKDSPDLLKHDIVDLLAHLGDLPEALRTPVRNVGGSHLNHSIFWATMGPNGGGQPIGTLAQDVNATFGNFDTLKARMNDTALKIFGSGWAWLVLDGSGKLQIISRPNQDAPVMDGFAAIIGIDMFEHAHYLKYQNRRNEYVAAFWNVINWESVGRRYEQARASAK